MCCFKYFLIYSSAFFKSKGWLKSFNVSKSLYANSKYGTTVFPWVKSFTCLKLFLIQLTRKTYLPLNLSLCQLVTSLIFFLRLSPSNSFAISMPNICYLNMRTFYNSWGWRKNFSLGRGTCCIRDSWLFIINVLATFFVSKFLILLWVIYN